jgi:Tol biopolymer transport system component
MTTLITPAFLFDYATPAEFDDYRCVVNAAGTQVIFERAPYDPTTKKSGPSELYLLTLGGDSPAPLFQPSIAPETNRPDWFWGSKGTVAFSYIPASGDTANQVGTAESTGSGSNLLGSLTNHRVYPTWFPDGKLLAVMNSTNKAAPSLAILYSSTGKTERGDVQGSSLWSGMPSVNQTNSSLIAFAGQPQAWGGAYDQDKNYIWVVDTSVSPPAPVPLEVGAWNQTGSFDKNFQGRAPWWSPDGAWVVFESNRASPPSRSNKNGMYAIFVYKFGSPGPAIQITAPSYDCNHAKWFPNGFNGVPGPFKLIVAAWQNGGATPPLGPYGLASLDLTPLNITF